jgi:hypothetical protein
VLINPLEYRGWDSLLATHDENSFFHSSSWARVLHETYGHTPVYFCGFSGKRLGTLLPVMEVSSAVTGRRGVSLPFSDYCRPFIEDVMGRTLYKTAMEYGREHKWKYLECRDKSDVWSQCDRASKVYHGHVIEIADREEKVFQRFDGPVRRGIRKAESEGVQIDIDTSMRALQGFFKLHCLTRQRHGLPPQPFRFFDNIRRFVFEAGHGLIATARLGMKPVAALVFFYQGTDAIFKFGASDYSFQQARPNNLAMWEAIRRLAANGITKLHLGRTSLSHEGLRRFKLGFGAREERIEYRKYDFARRAFVTSTDRKNNSLTRLFRLTPLGILRLTGEILYRHLS